MLNIEPEIDKQKQHDQARPMAKRNRDGRQSELVDGRCNDAEDQAARCRLGDEVANRHADRDTRIFPWICSLPASDEQPLEQRRDQENREENQYDRACCLAEQFVKAEVEFHRLLSCHFRRNRGK